MPPSPASRRSPSREVRPESHKRGRSLEGGLVLKAKDDDLALFNDMQTREREDFLVQYADDFEDAFTTKLRHFSDSKIGITIPARGESSDLLNADGEKNDYDWLLTPPDTPLFPSLDDEPAPVDTPLRGRQRSQPISISRSSTMEKSYRSSRGSASPSRSSPSPRSGNSNSQSRVKPSSAPHTSPISSQRSPTPTRRASPPPSKPSTPAPRSSSPAPRRMSTGSNVSAGTTGVRGMSPGKATRGNSASPKIRAWQANIPGFSCEVPPNLRTSLADRPASYVRGSSPASRNGRDSSSKTNRQSMSPTASRSVSSSYSHERDWFSSHSKGSIASSGDDDVDSLQSVTVGSLDQSTPRKVGGHANSSRSLAFSRKPAKLSSSAPKRSFDSVLRQMDNRKAPQNMFRPLLSSVPSTTFFVGKPGSAHSIISRHSSVTSSSNTSSDQGTNGLPDPEGNYYNHMMESGSTLCPDVQDEVFAFDKDDDADLGNEIYDGAPSTQPADFGEGLITEIDPANSGDCSTNEGINPVGELSHVDHGLCEVDLGFTGLCSLCGCSYDATDPVEMDVELCPKCKLKAELSGTIISETPTVLAGKSSVTSVVKPEESQDLDNVGASAFLSGSTYIEEPKPQEADSLDKPLSTSVMQIHEHRLSNDQGLEQPTEVYLPEGGISAPEPENLTNHLNVKVTAAEGAGISLLLNRSSSSKGLVVQGRTFTASTFPYDDLSYARDSANSMRSSIGHRSVSLSSSIDMSSSGLTEMRVLRQLSGKKYESENSRYEAQLQSIGSSISGGANYSPQALGVVTSTFEERSGVSVGNKDSDVSEETAAASMEQRQDLEREEADFTCSSSTKNVDTGENDSEHSESGRKVNSSSSEPSSYNANMRLEDDSMPSIHNFEGALLAENGECLQENTGTATDLETLAVKAESPGMDNATLNTCISVLNCSEVSSPANGSSITISEIEVDNGHHSISGPEVNEVFLDSNSAMDESQEASKKDMNGSSIEPNTSEHVLDILEESIVTMEGRTGTKSRSLTLEEATDTILFCSSIVHDIAYNAAAIAMEKESREPLEGFRPTVTIVAKSPSDRKDPRSGRIVSKRGLKPHKARQRRTDSDKKIPPSKTENNENIDESLTRNVGVPHKLDSEKPPRLESKCNCTIM